MYDALMTSRLVSYIVDDCLVEQGFHNMYVLLSRYMSTCFDLLPMTPGDTALIKYGSTVMLRGLSLSLCLYLFSRSLSLSRAL